MKANDGGPAFPVGHEAFIEKGMSLRDWFAGQALSGYLAMHSDVECSCPEVNKTADYCFMAADAMLAAREK